MSSWVRYRFEHLRRWREYAEAVARAARDLDPGARVYVFGGVAEDRVTVLSDIDILVILSRTIADEEISNLRARILVRAMDIYGLPFDAPVDLHVADLGRAQRYLRHARRLIEV